MVCVWVTWQLTVHFAPMPTKTIEVLWRADEEEEKMLFYTASNNCWLTAFLMSLREWEREPAYFTLASRTRSFLNLIMPHTHSNYNYTICHAFTFSLLLLLVREWDALIYFALIFITASAPVLFSFPLPLSHSLRFLVFLRMLFVEFDLLIFVDLSALYSLATMC